jgi:hypothetical protein
MPAAQTKKRPIAQVRVEPQPLVGSLSLGPVLHVFLMLPLVDLVFPCPGLQVVKTAGARVGGEGLALSTTSVHISSSVECLEVKARLG